MPLIKWGTPLKLRISGNATVETELTGWKARLETVANFYGEYWFTIFAVVREFEFLHYLPLLQTVEGAIKVIASIDKSAGKPICTAHAALRVRHRDVSNEHPLVIKKILNHLNTKNDEVVELLPQQSRAPPQISLFE